MEADWEVEIGGEAPVIDALWPGFVDLRHSPERVSELQESAQFPALAAVLVRLNADGSRVWTSKCDVWQVNEFDPDELDAPCESALHATACYIELLPENEEQWPTPVAATEWCGKLCTRLHAVPLRCARVDFIVRQAIASEEGAALGVTAYLTASGPTEAAAARVLAAALAALADSILPVELPARAASKLQ